MGEGLNIATNYVQESNKRKQEEKDKVKNDEFNQDQDDLFPNRNRTRVNNRGPPNIANIPFESIPLELLNSQSGSNLTPQRPFRNRIPGQNIRPPNLEPPPRNPLPLQFPPALPTRPGYDPGFLQPDQTEPSELENTTELETPTESIGTNSSENSSEQVIQESPDETTVQDSDETPPDRNNLLQNFLNENIGPVEPSSEFTTVPPLVDIEPSFTPPVLVTPQIIKKRPLRYRPPRPQGRPPRPQRPPLSVPTPPLNTRPFVFPSRPGLVLPDDGPVITGIAVPADNDVFDLTVTAQQNFGGKPNKINYQDFGGIITKARPGDQFVSIDGKRTYFDLGGSSAVAEIEPPRATRVPFRQQLSQQPSRPLPGRGEVIGATLKIGGEDILHNYSPPVGSSLPVSASGPSESRPPTSSNPILQTRTGVPGPTRRPAAPPVRIDTCIVGNDATCKMEQHEVCRTALGVSSCYCKPGYGRRNHRLLCRKTVKLLISLKLDKMKETKLEWNSDLRNQNSESFQVLEGEVNYAIDSAMSLTSFSNIYMQNEVNTFYTNNRDVVVNTTIELAETGYTRSEVVKRDIQKKLVEVIQARDNNIGNGNLYAVSRENPIPLIGDFNECSEPEANDCGDTSLCINTFGGFICQCKEGYEDKYPEDPEKSGRFCASCPEDFCSNHGVCSINGKERTCDCIGNYYGEKCEVDGEVLGVAVGASVAAFVIILLTLVCLCMWSRRWKREQDKSNMSRGYNGPYIVGTLPPPPSYLPSKLPPSWAPQPSPAYPRWAGHMEGSHPQNIYAQPIVYSGSQEPLYMSPTEPPMSIYGTVPADQVSIYGTLPRQYGRMAASEFAPFAYATLRKNQLASRPSLEDYFKQDRRNDKSAPESESDTSSLKEKLSDENMARITRGVTFQNLRYSTLPLPEPGTRRAVQGQKVGHFNNKGGQRGPLPSIPRPSTSLGTRNHNPPLIETSESEDTENGGRIQRPRSSLMAGNLNAEDDFESEYLRYGGTVGVRNPRLVAAMRGIPPYQQHIQMNMMNRF